MGDNNVEDNFSILVQVFERYQAAKIYGDFHYQAPIYEMAKLFGTKKNLYQYKIDAEMPFDYNLQMVPPYKGTGHASDLFYLFDRPISHNFERYFTYFRVISEIL